MQKSLYPAITPYKTHQIQVDAIHALHLEECGNPAGIPVVFNVLVAAMEQCARQGAFV